MTKTIACALLLTGLIACFAACGDKPVDPPKTDDTEVITEITVETTTEEITTEPDEIETTLPDETTTEAPEEGLADPTKLAKAELVEWYNDRVNYVREAKPGISLKQTQKMDEVKTSILGGIADPIINPIIKSLMPGDPEYKTIKKGQVNHKWFTDAENKAAKDKAGYDNLSAAAKIEFDNPYTYFMAPTKTSAVKLSDLTDIKAVKSGVNYVVTLTLGSETNPSNDGNSKYSRVMSVASRQEVLDELEPFGVKADINKAKLNYYGGKAEITVNPAGEIIKAAFEFRVDADAKEVKASILTADIVGKQSSSNIYTDFKY